MIIDVHNHFVQRNFISEDWWTGWVKRRIARDAPTLPPPDLEKLKKEFVTPVHDATGERVVSGLEAAGIDMGVLLPLDFGMLIRDPETSIVEQNRRNAELARKYPHRLIAFVGLDPNRGQSALDLFETGVKEWGMRGLKLHPCAGFYVNDKCVYPFYELAQDLNVTVLTHLGTEFPPIRAKYGQPVFLDDVGCDFPRLRIIGAHVGSPWDTEAIKIASIHDNIYLDIAGRHFMLFANAGDFYRNLRMLLDILPYKLVFGTDYEFGPRERLKEYVDAVREAPRRGREHGVNFTEEEIDLLLSGNAKRALGMD
ncbi:MAG: amidohydrolase [Chloroflexi bacterium]|nr:amidohydrolase [Chloroflexota bacterium]